MAKADRFIKSMSELNKVDKKWILGNETEDPLRYAFDAKRMVHPGVKGKMLPKEEWLSTWNNFIIQKSGKTKRAAYIHIPFCQTRCLYCGFFQNFSNKGLEDAYMDRLIAELRMEEKSPFITSHPFYAVYIGGGTPPALSTKNIKRLLKAINESLPLANDCEFTFEARIHDFDDEKIYACIEGGVNRFSLGVQSFNTKGRRSIKKKEKREKVMDRLKYIHSLDQSAVIIDLMYGLPYQTMDVWEDDINTMFQTEIDGCDLYQLNVFKDSKLKSAIDKESLPPAAKTSEQALMFKRGIELMNKNRFKRLSIPHWGRNSRERNLYNSLSKFGAVTIPFGCGAAGKINGCTFFLERNIQVYMLGLDRREKPFMFMMAPPEDYDLYSDIIGQMDRGQLNLIWIKARYGINIEELLSPLFKEWIRKGLIEINDDYLDLTIAGEFWYINLTQAILDCLVMLREGNSHALLVRAIAAQG